MRYGKRGNIAAALICAAVVAGCSGGSNESTGTVSISLMDRPVDGVTELWVTIDEVWIKPQGNGPATRLEMTSTPMTVDLLSLTDENAAVLVDEAVVAAGSYNWIEFKIDDTDISKSYAMTMAGGQMPVDVDVPSDKIRLVSGFDVGENQGVRLLFDWEVSKGLTEAVGRNLYILKPAFRILSADAYGSISGRVTNNTAMTDPVCSAVAEPMVGKVVYFFEGSMTPDDIDSMNQEPVTTADAEYDSMTGDYLYRAVLMPGDYTVALTCLGALEKQDSDDLMFLSPLDPDNNVVEVSAATPTVDVDF